MLEVYSVVLSVGTGVLEATARPTVENTVENRVRARQNDVA